MFTLVEVELPEGRPVEEGTLRFTCVGGDGVVHARTEVPLGEGFGPPPASPASPGKR
jgi:hypothetical protein